MDSLQEACQRFLELKEKLLKGGDPKRQHALKRMTARERLKHLLDDPDAFFELGLFAGYKMYEEWGELPAAGVITGIGKVANRSCMVIANDATVKAGAFFPQSVKKVLRAQRIAFECRLPILYLVDSSGVFLPMQDEIFPDEDDFGRIFRNNAVLSSSGIPQISAIMGNCIAGGGYLPVLSDTLLMTEGSGLYLAGPALVKAAIGQVVDGEALGGAKLHGEESGTVDFVEKDDESCLKRMKEIVEKLPEEVAKKPGKEKPKRDGREIYKIFSNNGYDARELLECIFDEGSFAEYKKDYGKTLVTGFATLFGIPCGVVANQRRSVETARGEIELGGVIYSDSADKAARFILDCNQMQLPIVFFQDVFGFMVGKEAEASGIIRSGAKLVNAISNSVVPKITCIIGSSFGAGHYALCGKAYDPNFIVAWPNAKYAVMGKEQAKSTLHHIWSESKKKKGETLSEEALDRIYDKYEEESGIFYSAARGFVDAIILPEETRSTLGILLKYALRNKTREVSFKTGVIQT